MVGKRIKQMSNEELLKTSKAQLAGGIYNDFLQSVKHELIRRGKRQWRYSAGGTR